MIFNCKRSKRELSHKSPWDHFGPLYWPFPGTTRKRLSLSLHPESNTKPEHDLFVVWQKENPQLLSYWNNCSTATRPAWQQAPVSEDIWEADAHLSGAAIFVSRLSLPPRAHNLDFPLRLRIILAVAGQCFFVRYCATAVDDRTPTIPEVEQGHQWRWRTATQMTEGNDRQPCRGTELLNFSSLHAVVTRSTPKKKKCDLRQISAF